MKSFEFDSVKTIQGFLQGSEQHGQNSSLGLSLEMNRIDKQETRGSVRRLAIVWGADELYGLDRGTGQWGGEKPRALKAVSPPGLSSHSNKVPDITVSL